MGTLRDNDPKRKDAKAKLKALWGELLDHDADLALKTIDWYLEKTNINKKHLKEMELRKQLKVLEASAAKDAEKISEVRKDIKQTMPSDYPNTIFSGDILHVKFGIGVGVELSEGHYAIILSRKGSNFLIAPLTSSLQPDKENTVFFESLGLPGEKAGQKTYVNFGQIRYVHFRRIAKIIGVPDGKRQVSKEQVEEILNKYNAIARNGTKWP